MLEFGLDVDDAGVDYLRLKAEDRGAKEWIWKTWNDHLEETEGHSAVLTPKRRSQGQRLNWNGMGVTWHRTGPSWLQASGEVASTLVNLKDISLLSASRMDIQASGSVSGGGVLYPGRLYQWWNNQEKGKAARMGCTLVQSRTGQTCYLGGRTAPRFLRVYDKGAQKGTHQHGRYLRIELEMKRKLASDWFDAFVTSTSRADMVLDTLAEYMASVNVQVHIGQQNVSRKVPLVRSGRTPRSMIEWLESSVRPVVVQLNRQGYNSDVIKALGLKGEGE